MNFKNWRIIDDIISWMIRSAYIIPKHTIWCIFKLLLEFVDFVDKKEVCFDS